MVWFAADVDVWTAVIAITGFGTVDTGFEISVVETVVVTVTATNAACAFPSRIQRIGHAPFDHIGWGAASIEEDDGVAGVGFVARREAEKTR